MKNYIAFFGLFLAFIFFADAHISIDIFNVSFRVILKHGATTTYYKNNFQEQDSILLFKEWSPIIDTAQNENQFKITSFSVNDTIENVPDDAVISFIEQNEDICIDAWKHGVLPSVKMAQAIIESASGTSNICLNANNYFGIKCKSCSYSYNGWSIFKSKESCFAYHNKLFKNDRYLHLLWNKSIVQWAEQLQACGYAGNSQTYSETILYNVMLYDLYKLDEKAFQIFNNNQKQKKI